MKPLVGTAGITYLSLFGLSTTGSLADVEHVVLFMQENRAFDHVFVLCPLSSLTSD
jgi:phospholipase C